MTIELDLSNYAIKTDLKNATGADTSKFAKKVDLASLKYNVDQCTKKNVPSNMRNLKSKLNKLVPVPVNLSKLSNVVKNYVIKKDVYNAKTKNIEDKIPDITNLAASTTLNAKINEVKGEIPSITNLATTTVFTAVKNKIPNVSNLVKELTITQKINEIENKIIDHDHDKYITIPEFNNLTSKNVAARLVQVNSTRKNDIAF